MLGLGSLGSQPVSSLDIVSGNTYNDSLTLSATAGFAGTCFVGIFPSLTLSEIAGFTIAVRTDFFPTISFNVLADDINSFTQDTFPSESFNSTAGFVLDPGAIYDRSIVFSETAGFTVVSTVGSVFFDSTAGFSATAEHDVYNSLTLAAVAAHIVASATVIPLGAEFDSTAGFNLANGINAAGNITYAVTAGFNPTVMVVAIDSESFNSTAGFSSSGGFDLDESISFNATDTFTIDQEYLAGASLLLFSAAGFGINLQADTNPTITYAVTAGFLGSDANILDDSVSFTETADFIIDGDARQSEIYLVSTAHIIVANQEAAGPPETIGATASVSFTSGLIANRSVHHTLTISSTATFVLEKNVAASNFLSILSSAVKIQEHTRSINHNLVIDSEATTSTTYNRSASNQLVFQSTFNQTIGINDFVITVYNAVATVQKVSCQVILQSAGSVIVLPCPILGDSQRPTGLTINVMHSINGLLYTTVKKSPLQTLKYTFQLDRRKGLELRTFLQNNLSNLITLYNFKGETWVGYIINQPDLIAKSRWAPCGPMNEVTLDFEGTKTGG